MSEPKKEVLVFSTQLGRHSYGTNHPLKVERLQLTMDLIGAYGLFDTTETPWVEAQEADEQDLLLIHQRLGQSAFFLPSVLIFLTFLDEYGSCGDQNLKANSVIFL